MKMSTYGSRTVLLWALTLTVLVRCSLVGAQLNQETEHAEADDPEQDEKTLRLSAAGMDLVRILSDEDKPPPPEKVAAFLKQEFGLLDEEYQDIVMAHDVNLNGRLEGEEILSAAMDVFERLQEKLKDAENAKRDQTRPKQWTNWNAVYIMTGVAGLYMLYSLWKARQERQQAPRDIDRDRVRSSWTSSSRQESPLRRRGAIRRKHLNTDDSSKESGGNITGDVNQPIAETHQTDANEDTVECENKKNKALEELEDSVHGVDNDIGLEEDSVVSVVDNDIVLDEDTAPCVPPENTDSVEPIPPTQTAEEPVTEEVLASLVQAESPPGEQNPVEGNPKGKEGSPPEGATVSTPQTESPPGGQNPVEGNPKRKTDSPPEGATAAKSAAMDTKDLTPQDIVKVLSEALNTNVELIEQGSGRDKWSAASFSVRSTDLPTTETDAPIKSHVVFERRLAREYLSKIKLCITSYYACGRLSVARQHQQQLLLQCMLGCLRKEAVAHLMAELQKEAVTGSEEDDIWSDYASASNQNIDVAETELTKFLGRLAGWAQDGVSVGGDLLADLLQRAKVNPQGCKVMGQVIRSGGHILKDVQRLDELKLSCGKTIRGLEIFLSQSDTTDVLGELLQLEIQEASTSLGSCFEKDSTLGPLMTVTTIPDSLSAVVHKFNSPTNVPWVTLKNFPKVAAGDLHSLEAQIQEGLRQVQMLSFQTLKCMMKSKRETGLAWLATLVNMNEARTTVTPQIQPLGPRDVQPGCSDGFMVNLCSVLLDLCLPFCQGDLGKLAKVDPSYSTSKACRLNYDFETCLAGAQIVSEKEGGNISDGSLPKELQGTFNFMTEIFHITQRALNVGFFPALIHFQKLQKILMSNISAMEGNASVLEGLKAKHLLFTLRWDCSLAEQELLRKGTQFYLSQAQWLTMLLAKAAEDAPDEATAQLQQRRMFAQLPEFIVKDMAKWFWFTLSHGVLIHQGALSGLQLAPFVDCCVTLLRRPDLMPGPIPAYRITLALLAFIDNRRDKKQSQGWGSGVMSNTSSIVFTCPAAQHHLGPALIHTYISVDVVEGLDVDKEDFDKYSARGEIATLLEKLWPWSDCRTSILNMCQTERFQAFLGAILDTLLYQLHDSLARLANVKKLQKAKDDGAWERLFEQEKKEQENFLASEEAVAKGFMRMATNTLELLDLLTKCEDVARVFTVQPLAQRAATAYLGFIDALCGPKASQLKVKDMDKYNFKPRQLLCTILSILLRIIQEEHSRELGFLACLAADTDYSEQSMQKALSVLRDQGVGDDEMVQQFETLVSEMELLRSALQAAPATPEVGGVYDWQRVIEAQCISHDALAETYETVMRPLSFGSVELLAHHSFQSNAASQPVDPRSHKCKALMKEMREWSCNLPLHAQAATYLRQDEERMDIVRVLVTGPPDTPYSLGCFVFDIYFPGTYPNNPPLVKLITTGNGTVRFNPNLYADGKVCLSLLGTWHSGDASQKWQPNKSTLLQVLLSIQSLILCPDPMYNEPGYEGMKGSAEVQAKSAEYNDKIRLLTLRHAVLGQLKNPPEGFQKIIRQHFRLQKDVLLQQCSRWLAECQDSVEGKKLRRVVDELRQLLEGLGEQEEQEQEQEEEGEEDA